VCSTRIRDRHSSDHEGNAANRFSKKTLIGGVEVVIG
jgi:hypothetical protein